MPNEPRCGKAVLRVNKSMKIWRIPQWVIAIILLSLLANEASGLAAHRCAFCRRALLAGERDRSASGEAKRGSRSDGEAMHYDGEPDVPANEREPS